MKALKIKILTCQCWRFTIFYEKILVKFLLIPKFNKVKVLKCKFQLKIIKIFGKIFRLTINKINIKKIFHKIRGRRFYFCQKKFIIIFLLSFLSKIQTLKAEILVENIKNDGSTQTALVSLADSNKNIFSKGNIDFNEGNIVAHEKTNLSYALSFGLGKKFTTNIFGNNSIIYNQIFYNKTLASADLIDQIIGYKIILAKKLQFFYLGFDINLAKLTYQNILNKNQTNFPKYTMPIGLVLGFELSKRTNFQINFNNNYFAQKFQKQKIKINLVNMGLVYDF